MQFTKAIFSISIIILAVLIGDKSLAKSGCCSWHGGVNHCDTVTGRIVCNDNTYSPSCMCERDSNNPKFRPDNSQQEINRDHTNQE